MPDLFISYAHVDKHWVDAFVPLLEQRVNQHVGRPKPDRIWKDNRLGSNTPLNPEIDAQLAQAQCLVSILSPGYLASEWCMYELATFSARVGAASGRIFCVELDFVAIEHKPKALTHALGSRFWWQDANSKRTYPLNPGEPGFEKCLIDLAKDIANILRGENPPQSPFCKGGSQELPQPVNPASSSPLCKRGAGGDFLQQKRESLEKRRALLQELLTRQQEELTFADDPKRQMRLERDINTTKASLSQVDAELFQLVHLSHPL